MKIGYLGLGWRALFTGEADGAVAVVQSAAKALDAHHSVASVEDVIKACESGFRAEWERCADGTIFARYGTTLAKFRSNASDIGPQSRGELRRKLDKFDLGVKLLVCGVGNGGMTYLVTVASPGLASLTNVRDVADGSGWDWAQRGLGSRDASADLFATIYRVCAAKFDAESAPHVDKFTTLSWMDQQGEIPVPDKCVKQLREVWEASKNDTPHRAIDILRETFPEMTNAAQN